jgi:hypothetical protein
VPGEVLLRGYLFVAVILSQKRTHFVALVGTVFDKQPTRRLEETGRFEDDAAKERESVRASVERFARFEKDDFGSEGSDVVGWNIGRIRDQ